MRTYVDVDPDEFDTDELIEELGCRKLSPKEIEELREIIVKHGVEPPEDDVGRAIREEMAGRRGEALIWIERALGHFWIGRLAR